jgi:hypothetical protein
MMASDCHVGVYPAQSCRSFTAYACSDASSQGQGIARREMAVALESALDARRQHILVSHSPVSLVKWASVTIEAICVLIAIALSHGDKRAAALVAMGTLCHRRRRLSLAHRRL